jgi:preprotein translocase subunit SecG
MDLAINILSGIFVFVALLMILVILMQRPKSEGLGAAFGGGVTENIFDAQTTNVLTKITGWLAAIFFLLCFALSILYAQKSNSSSNLGERVKKNLPPPVATSATPTATPSPGPSGTAGPSTSVTSPTPTASGPAPSIKPTASPAGTVAPATSPAPTSSPATSVQPSAAPSASASPRR